LKEPETESNNNGCDSDKHQYQAAHNPFNADPICILSSRHTVRILLPDCMIDAEMTGSQRRHKQKHCPAQKNSDDSLHNFSHKVTI
jgi:hypothetical protein